jgi:hypothetical protein
MATIILSIQSSASYTSNVLPNKVTYFLLSVVTFASTHCDLPASIAAHLIHSPFFGFLTPLVQSTTFLSCSSVRKMRMVVGCSRVKAGTQPLNMNMGPSALSEARITPIVDWDGRNYERATSVEQDDIHWSQVLRRS